MTRLAIDVLIQELETHVCGHGNRTLKDLVISAVPDSEFMSNIKIKRGAGGRGGWGATLQRVPLQLVTNATRIRTTCAHKKATCSTRGSVMVRYGASVPIHTGRSSACNIQTVHTGFRAGCRGRAVLRVLGDRCRVHGPFTTITCTLPVPLPSRFDVIVVPGRADRLLVRGVLECGPVVVHPSQ